MFLLFSFFLKKSSNFLPRYNHFLLINRISYQKGLFLSGNEDKLPLVDELLKKVAFLTVELRGLEKTIKKQGTVQVSNKGTTRTNPNLKSYLSMLNIYQGIIKTFNSILDTDITQEDDAFDEFIKKAFRKDEQLLLGIL